MLLLNLPLFNRLHDARQGWIPLSLHVVKPVSGLVDRDRYLRRRLESYPAVAWANRHLPASARIVSFGEAAHFHARAELLHDFSRCVVHAAWARPGQEEAAWRGLRAAGVTHVLWDLTQPKLLVDSAFAIRSPTFRRRYAVPVYRDEVSEIDAIRPTPAADSAR